jgi:RNA polymerase sigma factor (sigma-70 family)
MGPTAPAAPRPAPRGDEAALFRTHHRRLLRLVAYDVSARPQVTEDPYAFAWTELLARQPERGNVIGWLRVVARRAAIRLAQYDRRLATSLAADDEHRAARAHPVAAEARHALGLVAGLAPRKRAVFALHISGHSYPEIVARLGMTERTVERQLRRARAAVLQGNADTADVPLTA